MTEISLIVTINNQFHLTSLNEVFQCNMLHCVGFFFWNDPFHSNFRETATFQSPYRTRIGIRRILSYLWYDPFDIGGGGGLRLVCFCFEKHFVLILTKNNIAQWNSENNNLSNSVTKNSPFNIASLASMGRQNPRFSYHI